MKSTTSITKWIKRIGSLVAVMALVTTQSHAAFARILFEDDEFFNVNSEGIILDYNDDVGSTATNISLQFGNDGSDASIDYAGDTGDITLATPGGDFNFSDDNITTTGDTTTNGLTANGAVDFSSAASFLLYQGAANPGTCTEGEVFYNTTDNTTYICTATNTWTGLSSGNPDFEAVYAADGDSTLTASGTFDIAATGAVGIDSASTVTIGGAGISLTSDGGADVTVTAADDVIFDDAQLTGIVQLSDTDSDWDATFAGNGIVDNINSFASTANGEGASNVGIEDASTWFTGTEIETALNEIEALFGSTTSSTFNFTEDNVLTDNDAVYTALNKLDLKWGDLASTANGEGASLVGIEDTGGYFTGTTVESVLQELGADIGNNYEDLTFYPEYPDAVVYTDGSNNKGTLESFYDATEESGYYNWTVQNGTTQDIDIRFDFPLPTDFSATGNFTFRYRTGTTTEADNDVEVTLYNVTDSQACAADLTNGTAGVWATGTITAGSIDTGCTGGTALNAGDIVEVQIKLADVNGAGTFADVGALVWNYTK